MNEYEEFLNGATALVAGMVAIGMLVCAVRAMVRDRQRIAAMRAGTAAPLPPPGSTESSPVPVGAPPETYKRYRLLITGCSDGLLWYAGKIGQEVPYLGTWPNEGCHKSREDAGYINIVKMQDARVIIYEEKVRK